MGEYKLNKDRSAVVSTGYTYHEDMITCPRGAKCILLSKYGVAVITEYQGDPFWVGWAPLPKRRVTPPLSQTSA